MDIVNVWAIIAVVIFLLVLLFELGVFDKLVGIEYFEKKYTFQGPMSAESVKELFRSIQLKGQYPKGVSFYINVKQFYSISDKGMNTWSPWIPFGEMPDKSFKEYEIRYKDAWSIVIHGYDYIHCAVYNGDSNLLYTDEMFQEIRLVGLGIVKYPWNRWKIKKERKFLEYIVSALQEELNEKKVKGAAILKNPDDFILDFLILGEMY